jgi:hypothetical protein
MMEAICSSETSVLTRATRCNIPEDCILHSHHRENLKSYKIIINFNLSKTTQWRHTRRLWLSSTYSRISHVAGVTMLWPYFHRYLRVDVKAFRTRLSIVVKRKITVSDRSWTLQAQDITSCITNSCMLAATL